MRFLYLIQGKAENVSAHLFLNTANSSLAGLTYDRPEEGFDYLPGSSYTQGRNHLYGVALERIDRYDYFVFLDDDISFVRGSFLQMERNLALHQSLIGVPVTEKCRRSVMGIEFKNKIYPFVKKQKFFINDEQYLAVHRTVMQEGRIFPCLEDWDEQSWYVSSLIQEALIQMYYWKVGLQFNDCEISNNDHSGGYPHNLEFAASEYKSYMSINYREPINKPATYDVLFTLGWPQMNSFGNLYRIARSYLGRARESGNRNRISTT